MAGLRPVARASALALAAVMLCALAAETHAAGPRQLLQRPKDAVTGKAIRIHVEYPGNQHAPDILAVRTPKGQMVRLQAQDINSDGLKGFKSGANVEVRGRWTDPRAPGGRKPPAKLAGVEALDASVNAELAGKGNGNGNDDTAVKTRFTVDEVKVTSLARNEEDPIITPYVEYEGPLPDFSDELPTRRRSLLQTAGTPVTVSNPLVVRSMTTLFIPIQARTNGNPGLALCPGTSAAPLTKTQIQQTVFEELSSGDSVGEHFNQCSFNKTKLTMDNSMVADLVTIPCSGNTYGVAWSTATCDFEDFSAWADVADQKLAARGIDVSDYAYKVYMVPPNTACGWLGLGYIGCDGSYACRAWVGGSVWGVPAAHSHELGHNLFMGHAGSISTSGVVDEYGDDSCMMGYCCEFRCLNTPHAWQMGWVNLRQFDGNSLPAGTTYTTTIAAQALTSTVQPGIRIVPTWAPSLDPIYVGFRVRTRADNVMPLAMSNRVLVYTSKIANRYDSEFTHLRTTLLPDQSWTYPAANIVIRRQTSNLGAYAAVTVCRRGAIGETASSCANNIDWNCNGLAGADDPLCIPYLK